MATPSTITTEASKKTTEELVTLFNRTCQAILTSFLRIKKSKSKDNTLALQSLKSVLTSENCYRCNVTDTYFYGLISKSRHNFQIVFNAIDSVVSPSPSCSIEA